MWSKRGSAKVSVLICLCRGGSAESPHFEEKCLFYTNVRISASTTQIYLKFSGFILDLIMDVEPKFRGFISTIVCSGSFINSKVTLRLTRGTPGLSPPQFIPVKSAGLNCSTEHKFPPSLHLFSTKIKVNTQSGKFCFHTHPSSTLLCRGKT